MEDNSEDSLIILPESVLQEDKEKKEREERRTRDFADQLILAMAGSSDPISVHGMMEAVQTVLDLRKELKV